MKTLLATIVMFLACFCAEAASPSFASFDTNTMVVIPQSGSNPTGFIGVDTNRFPTTNSLGSLYDSNGAALYQAGLSSNYSLTLSQNGTNESLQIGLANSNLTYQVGLASTNLSNVASNALRLAVLNGSIPAGQATNLAGPQAAIIAGVTTNFTTPEQFGAVGNGIADDSAAWSNMAAAVSARLSAPTVYASKKYVCLTTGYNFATSNFMMFGGGTIYTGDTNHWVIGRPNGVGKSYNNWGVYNMTIIRTNGVTVAPNTNCYGIWMATDDPTNQGSYSENFTIENCTIIGFQSAIVVGGETQGLIEHDNAWDCWSNCVTFMGPNYVTDMIHIYLNDFNSLDGGLTGSPLPMSVLQTLSVIEWDGENLGVDMENNDIAGACQVIKVLPTSPGIGLRYYQNEVEAMYNNNTNLTLLQLWNSSWQIGYSSQCGYGPAFFGSSNYLGYVGAYASNQLSLRLDHIISMSPANTVCHVDMWQNGSTNGSGYADATTSPDIDPPANWAVTTHTNFLDAGFSTIGSNHKSLETLFTNIIQVNATGLPSGFEPVLNIGPGIMTVNNWNGGFVEFVKSVAFDNPFTIPSGTLFTTMSDRGGASSQFLVQPNTHVFTVQNTAGVSDMVISHDTNVLLNTTLTVTNTVFANQGVGSSAAGFLVFSATGVTNTSPRNYRIIDFEGTSVTFSNPTSGVSASLGTLTTPTEILLQPGEKLIGTLCSEATNCPF